MATNESLRAELVELAAQDNDDRRSASDSLEAQDAARLKRLREIVDECGWPGRALVGEDGADAAWLLVQHADAPAARAFRRTCLELMHAATPGDVDPRHVAYLADRIALLEGLLDHGEPGTQEFGTQIGSITLDDGSEREFPVVDDVDSRRASVGLPTLEETAALMVDHGLEEPPLPYGVYRQLARWEWPPT